MLFIDEIHRLGRPVEEILYPAMEDFQLDIVVGKGPAASSIRLPLPRFTMVGATTRTGLITGPLRDRFGFVARLDFYARDELRVDRAAGRVRSSASRSTRRAPPRSRGGLAALLASRTACSGGCATSPRFAATARSIERVASDGLALFGVDRLGLDKVDRAILRTICERFGGGPVGSVDPRDQRRRAARDRRGRLRAVPHAAGACCSARRAGASRQRRRSRISASRLRSCDERAGLFDG